MFSCEFCEILKYTFFHWALSVAASRFNWSDHPSNNKKGCIAIYYKKFPFSENNRYKLLNESIIFEPQVCSKICKFISLYQSPSQTTNNFDLFFDHMKLSIDRMSDINSFLVVAIVDFNTRSSSWYINDKNNYERTKNNWLFIYSMWSIKDN